MQTTQVHFFWMVILTLSIVGCSAPGTPAPSVTPSAAITPPSPVVLETIQGSFRNQISILEENMPRSGSEAYVVPDQEEQADFSRLVSMIQREELADAVQLAGNHSYSLAYYVDKGDDYATSYLLREQRPIQKGWGLYAFRLDSTSNLIIEAPHPLYDRRTPSVALDVYRALDARALLVAGAHRKANKDGSADVAHAPESIFQSIHQTLSQGMETTSGKAVILQIHGFHSSKHDGYPQAVIGFGEEIQAANTSLIRALGAALEEQGIRVGLCTDDAWKSLCGRTNGQGATSHGNIFIHLELDEKIRRNDEALIAALVQALGQ